MLRRRGRVTREKRRKYLEHIVNCECLPHQGLTDEPEVLRAKALYLGLMVRKMIRVHRGELPCDDRDHYSSKRVDCAGTQFGLLFRQVFRTVQRSLAVQMHRAAEQGKLRKTNVGNLVSGKKLTQAFRYALATGNWGIQSAGGTTAQHGVAQQLGRITVPATLSLLRKVSTPVAREACCAMRTSSRGEACGLPQLTAEKEARVHMMTNMKMDMGMDMN